MQGELRGFIPREDVAIVDLSEPQSQAGQDQQPCEFLAGLHEEPPPPPGHLSSLRGLDREVNYGEHECKERIVGWRLVRRHSDHDKLALGAQKIPRPRQPSLSVHVMQRGNHCDEVVGRWLDVHGHEVSCLDSRVPDRR
jgi:hypothetical protein